MAREYYGLVEASGCETLLGGRIIDGGRLERMSLSQNAHRFDHSRTYFLIKVIEAYKYARVPATEYQWLKEVY